MKRTFSFPAQMFLIGCAVLLVIAWSLLFRIVFAGSQQTSSTTAATVITNARYYLNEATPVQWSDAELLVWVNQGTMDIQARTHCLEDTEAETLIEGTTHYSLADPFLAIKGVVYDDGTKQKSLKRGNLAGRPDINSFGYDTRGDGEPSLWTQWENQVIVYPSPDSTTSGNTITVYVVDRPVAVTSTQTVLVPAHYDKALVLYVVSQAFYKTGQFNKAGYFTTLYFQELDRYRLDFNEDQTGKK